MANAGDQFKITDAGDRRRRLQDDVPLVAGVDPDDKKTPRFLPIGAAGVKVDTQGGGFALPRSDWAGVTYFGLTNNIQQLTYKLGGENGTTVAVLIFAYLGGGAADDDKLISIRRV